MAQLKNTIINDTGSIKLPEGTTAQRPSPQEGQLRFNTSTGKNEYYNADIGGWVVTDQIGVVATGGNAVYDVNDEGATYRVHVFTSTGNSTFSVDKGGEVEYLIVAGGGGGGAQNAAGGGAGGLVQGTTTVTPQNYTITVGAGAGPGPRDPGAGNTSKLSYPNGIRGDNSNAFGLTAIGGGNGSGDDYWGVDGGSGGGGADDPSRAGPGDSVQNSQGSTGFGFPGGDGRVGGNGQSGAGGGGAGAAGSDNDAGEGPNQRRGGSGMSSSISGILTYFAGGGGGAGDNRSAKTVGEDGGWGGGGKGGPAGGFAEPGVPNTGGGGGGNGTTTVSGNGGGSGIVIVRYPLGKANPLTAGTNNIGKFEESGLLANLDFSDSTLFYRSTSSRLKDNRTNVEWTINGSPAYNNNHRGGFNIAADENKYIQTSGNYNFGVNWTYELLLENFGDSRAIPLMTGTVGNDQRSKINLDLGLTNGGKSHIFLGSDWGTWEYFDTPRAFSDYSFFYVQVTMAGGTANVWVSTPQDGRIHPIDNGNYGTGGNTVRDLPILLGRYASTGYTLNGRIHLFRLYNRALSEQELTNNYNALRWRFGI